MKTPMSIHTRATDNAHSRFKEIFYIYDLETLELAMSFLAMFMGIWLILPFQGTTSSAAVNIIVRNIGETGFGSLILFAGFWLFYSLYFNKPKSQVFATFYHALVWLFITFTVILSNPRSFGVAIFAGLFFVSCYLYIRASHRVKRQEIRSQNV